MVFLEEIPVVPKPNKLPDALGKMEETSLSEHITSRAIELYTDQPKPLQVEAEGCSSGFGAIGFSRQRPGPRKGTVQDNSNQSK
ncbi:hypothetical protein MJO29_013986 [Puccinia striiformis f. sp. tritici]|nr:hypothetical protein MJO29_013986 [Puccinia striiformis f. sp. tritici]